MRAACGILAFAIASATRLPPTYATPAATDAPEPAEPPRIRMLHNPHPARVAFWHEHYRDKTALAYRRLVEWQRTRAPSFTDEAKTEGIILAISEDPTERADRLAVLASGYRAAARPAAKYAGARVAELLLARAEDPQAEIMARLSAILAAAELDRKDTKISARLVALALDETLHEDLRGAAIESASFAGLADPSPVFALIGSREAYSGCCRLRERAANSIRRGLGEDVYVRQIEKRAASVAASDRMIAAIAYRWMDRGMAQRRLVALLADRELVVRTEAARSASWLVVTHESRRAGSLDETFKRALRTLAADEPDPALRALAVATVKRLD